MSLVSNNLTRLALNEIFLQLFSKFHLMPLDELMQNENFIKKLTQLKNEFHAKCVHGRRHYVVMFAQRKAENSLERECECAHGERQTFLFTKLHFR